MKVSSPEPAEQQWTASERARAAALREGDERHLFLLRLSDALRPLSRPLDIQEAAARLLGKHLKASWAFYAEIDIPATCMTVQREYTRRGVPSLEGTYPFSSFELLLELQHGRTASIADIAASPRVSGESWAQFRALGMRSALGAPILKSDHSLLAVLVVADREVRFWRDAEIALVEDVGDRTWAAVERARAEARLQASEAALRESGRRKNEFLAMLGHELRNPIAALEGGVKLLQSPWGARPESLEVILPIVAKQVAHMKRLIDDVLDLAKLERGKLQANLAEVDLDAILKASLKMTEGLAQAKNMQIGYRPPSPPILLLADFERLVQVFTNLLTNAIKFSPANSEVELRAELAAGAVVSVRDQGRGIESENLAEIFEPFIQSKLSLGAPEGGLGLGLSVSRELVELHGGTIAAFSEGPNRGSTFVVSLPIVWSS